MNYFKLKFLLLFFALAVAIPPAWAETKTAGFTLSGATAPIAANANPATTTITGTQGETWNVAINGTFTSSSMQGAADRKYWQMGKSKASITSATFSTSEISGNIKSIAIDCAVVNGPGGSVSAIVGNSSFGSSELPKWENSTPPYHGDVVTLENSSNYQGDIVITIVPSEQNGCLIHSITVTYEEGGDTPPTEENIYQKVTNASQLVADKTYIIVNENANVGMGAVDDNRYGTVVTGLEFADGKVNIGGTEVTELTLGGKENAWTFMLPNSQYLAKGNNDNKFLLATSPTTNISKWTIDLSNGCSIINNDNSDESYRFIRYENNRFDISYGSNVALYVKYEGGDTPPTDDPTIEVDPTQLTINDKDENNTFTVTGSNLIDNVGVTASEGFSTNVTYLENNSGSAEGTVKVTYTGRDLYAQGTVEMGTDKDATGEDITKTVSITYQSDIYIVNNHGDNSWNFGEGIKMTYNDGVYTGTFTAENANTKIVFARMLGDGVDFDTRLVFGADSNDDWLYGTYTSGNLNLNDDVAIHFPLAGTYTITIDANAKTFSIKSSIVSDLTQANQYTEGETFLFGGRVVVTYQDGKNLWIRDIANRQGSTTAGYLYQVPNGAEFQQGDVINAGWKGKRQDYHGLTEIIPEQSLEKDGTADFTPELLTSIDPSTDINKYVKFEGVSKIVDNDGNTVELHDKFDKEFTFEEGKVYDVIGIVGYYNKLQFYPISYKDVTPKVLSVKLESETKSGFAGENIPVTVTVENAEGDYTVTYKFGETGTENTLTGNTINVTSETAGEVTLIVTVTNGDNQATAQETYTFTDPNAGKIYEKVTSTTQLKHGKKVIFVYNGQAMGALANGNDGIATNPPAVKVINDNTVDIEGTTAKEFILEQVDESNYKFKYAEDNKYLVPYGESDTKLKKADSDPNGWKLKTLTNAYGVNSNLTNESYGIKKHSSMDRFGHYKTSNDFPYVLLYVEKGDTPEPEPLAVTLPEAAEHYKVGQEVKVKATVENGSENTLLTYKVGEETLTPDNEGNVTLPNKKAGDVVVTVKATDGDRTANDSKTYVFDAAEALTITLNPAIGEYYVGAEAKVNVTVDKAITTNPTITYKFGEEGEAQTYTYNAETGIVLPTAEAGTINLTVTVDDNGYEHAGENTATGTYTVKAKEPAGLKFVIQKVEGQQDNTYQYFSIGKDPVKPTLENPNDLPVTYSVLSPEGIISIDAETGEVTLLGNSGTGSIVAETTGDETHAGGKVYLSFNVRPEVATYKLVTDASKLKADDKFIIVGTNQSGTFGMDMLSYGSDNNPVLGSQKVVIADNKIETNLPEVFTLKAVDSESANWYMQENTYRSQSLTYLTARGDNGLYFQNPGQNSEMSISIASDGKATIQFPNVDAESAKYLRMTKYANARFGRYETTDGSVPIYIYKQVIQEEPTLAFAEETPAKAYVGDELTLTVNNVPEGATLTFTSNPADAVEFDDNGKVTFLKACEVKITATTTETDEFLPGTVTYTITVENKPVVETDLEGNNLDLVAVVGESKTGKIIVSGENLKGDITLTLNDTKGVFAIDVTSIAKEDAIGEVTVTYTPKAATGEDFDKATVTIKSTDAETVTVNLTGMATLPDPVLTVSDETLEMGTEPTGTFTVTGQNLTENVTLTVTEGEAKNFEISPASITPNEEGKVSQEVTVTYKGNSTEDEYATITVKSGTASKEVIVTARVLPTPEIIAEPENLTMTAVVGQTPATATFTVMASDLRGDITLTMSESDVFTIEPATIRKADMTEDGVEVTVTYKPTQAGNDNATITIASEAAESATVTLAGTATVPEVVAMPTFSLVAGSYTGPQTVTIYCATEDATISYSTDGGQTWTKGNTVNVDKDMTIMAKASKDGYTISETATGYYVIDIPEALPTDMPTFDGYYSVLNSGKYANIQGRKTLTFTDAPDAQAGTVIRLKSDNTGKVEVLRSQAADLQRYAYRAMDYVPDIVQIVVDKLGAEGEGHILGKDGLDAIMTKFDESFKPDLYIEKAGDNGYRIYGRTPSMQPVVDFYRENKDKVEAKLPDLVAFINSALAKLRNKANQAGMDGDNVFVDFDLKTIWTRMGGNLTDPEVDEMGFYRDVLNYKDNVWNFAYQTATFYLEKIKNTGTYTSLSEQLGEFAQYLDKIDQIHPDFKYYIVANEEVTKPDFISQGNADIINNAERTIWTLEPRTDFTVNFPEANKHNGEYVTTLYTDFAYTLPEGVTAWAVTSVSDQGIGELTAIDGTTIAAQTPVLLKSTTAGDVATFGITTADGTAAPEGNLLVGPDYLIETYQIKTPEVVKMFEAIKTVLGENIYNDLVDKYGHLQFRTSGTVNNKYFWGLNEEEVKSCAEENPETGKKVKVVRSLGIKDYLLGFNDNEHVYTNKALLVSTEHSAINFSLRGDINKDGVISIIDVTALIDILLDLPAWNYLEPTTSYPKGLDYEAANVNENEEGIEITDVTTLIDILLNMPDQPAQGSGN